MTMRTKVVTSPEEIRADFDRLIREYPREVAREFEEFVDMDIGPLTQEQCPVATGNLQGSWTGAANGVVIEDGRLYIMIGYGTTYGFWVHEIPPGDLALPGGGHAGDVFAGYGRTAWHEPPTKWKYLEDPINEKVGAFPPRVVKSLDHLLTGGG